MKLIIAAAACMLFPLIAGAQASPKSAGKARVRKSAIAGTITDTRGRPIPKVQAYIYKGDSATNSSGYTDANGYFETNNVKAGTYDLRIVYPSAKRIVINGVPVKALKITQITVAATEPTADSAIAYAEVAPKAPAPKGR